MTDSKSINVSLSVARTEGGGNTADGRFFFAFDRNRIVVESVNSTLTFVLSADTAKDFVIDSLVSSDSREQLGAPESCPDANSISVAVKNEFNYLLQIALIVRHTRTGELIVCDPQVICRPKPVK